MPRTHTTDPLLWEKWTDPFELNEEEDEIYNDGYDENKQKGRAIMTNMGLVPINPNNTPGKIFNFWVAHSSLDLTREVINKVKKLPGIEIIKPLTRYRMQIGIGKQFNEDEVKSSVNTTIKGIVKSEDNGIE